ncbi:hypothetical protein B0H10DRAFT_1974475 [Mycena sp. CBHHK59/15]|nr:hypothetical protein B0H10DRAFT_1974475 [Mycena sp. CBHHK59/15]
MLSFLTSLAVLAVAIGNPTFIQGLSTGGGTHPGDSLLSILMTKYSHRLHDQWSTDQRHYLPPDRPSFFVTSGFGYFNSCNGADADCTGPNSPAVFESPDQTFKQVGCPTANVDLG